MSSLSAQRTALTIVLGAAMTLAASSGPPAAHGQAPSPTPTLTSTLPCASADSGAELTGSGWTPGGEVRLQGRFVSGASGEALDEIVRADAAGRIRFTSGVPNEEAITVGVEVTAEDVARTNAGAPAEQRSATTRFKLTYFGVFYRPWNTDGPAVGRPGRVRQIEAMGFLTGTTRVTDTLYAHYHRSGDPGWRTVRVGRLQGPCGGLKARFREFPFKRVRRGTYTVRFDTMPVAGDDTYESMGYLRVRVR